MNPIVKEFKAALLPSATQYALEGTVPKALALWVHTVFGGARYVGKTPWFLKLISYFGYAPSLRTMYN
jgi:hypothetical protein